MSRWREAHRPSGDPLRVIQQDEVSSALDAAAAHYGAGRLDAAASLYEAVLRRRPDDIRPLYSLGLIDLRHRRFEQARKRFKAVLRRQSDHFPATHNLAVAEQALGGWPQAASAFRRALALRPEAVESRFSLAVAEAVMGRTHEAISLYRALAAQPAHRVRALSRLAILRPAAVSEDELVLLEEFARTLTPGQERIAVLFALAGVLESRGRIDDAWAAFEAGNLAKHLSLANGPSEHRPSTVAHAQAEAVARTKSVYTAEFLKTFSGQGDRLTRPIFIIGFPRSGSSLIEQILSSHPQVRGMGESDTLADTINARFPMTAGAPQEPFHFRRLARDYLAGLSRRGWDGRSRPADKTLDNHLQVGMIHLMFPLATILVARRNPVDVGLACFRQLFAEGNETLYDLGEIAAEIRRHDEMMDHWRATLPGRVFEIRYESLVADPEVQIRRMVTQGCVLPWAPACLDFHATRSAVATASADEVRRPIFSEAVNRWRRYDARLGPLRLALSGASPRAGAPS